MDRFPVIFNLEILPCEFKAKSQDASFEFYRICPSNDYTNQSFTAKVNTNLKLNKNI